MTQTKEEKAKSGFGDFTAQTMEEALDKVGAAAPTLGDSIEGKVLRSSKSEISVDLGVLGMGVMRGQELSDYLEYAELPKDGEIIKATAMDLENENGEVELTLRKSNKRQIWQELMDSQKADEPLKVKIIEANKGGLIASLIGMPAFLPVSQLNAEHYPRVDGGDKNVILDELTGFIGDVFIVKLITVDREDEKLIMSEKAAEAEKQREKILDLKVGDRAKGKISGVVDFGAFIKFGEGLEGLIHISEIAWQRIDDPRDIVRVGQDVEAEIIAIEDTKISLSLKRLKDDPWAKSVGKYKIGQVVSGKVTRVTPFGAFVQLDEEIHGLVHVSEMKDKEEEEKETLAVGDQRDFKILSIEPKDHRLGLTMNLEEESKTAKQQGGKAEVDIKEETKNEKKAEDKSEKKEKTKEKKVKKEKTK